MKAQSELANKLKTILDQMTQEEFDSEWSKVTSLNLESKLLANPIESLSDNQLIDELKRRGYITKLLINRNDLNSSLSDIEKDEILENVDWGYHKSEVTIEISKLTEGYLS